MGLPKRRNMKTSILVLLILGISIVLARPSPEHLLRETREALPEPHRRSYSHSHYHRGTRNRGRGRSQGNDFVNNVLVPKAVGIGIGLIAAGIFQQATNGK